ncbi:transcriptional regulator, AraC family protein [Roseobacter sp. MED193]|uniref:helix-turn-helix transcriptional regulator n=1 Tax=Roseobacter sp. MED193 TaxID=314262 RepID=UPI000068E01C|nr:AraC family transcriptional regulator [Roseobacter sp. MED193]EAQ45500.1 transcriptional regulator, AraC family protein [Roseobacter sp. MED193]
MDRLTTLMERFKLSVHPAPLSQANLVALGDPGSPSCLVFFPRGQVQLTSEKTVLLSVRVDWGAGHNPLVAALPSCVDFDLTTHHETRDLVQVMLAESTARRCGAQSVVNRLGEVLMVRLLRSQIELGATEPGLLAGLADPRLSRAIVALHDHPGRVWSNGDLAAEAGLSLSRFSELFTAEIGETPMGYLRRWRLTLAYQDLVRGDRVEAVARRYAYASPEGFTRAFRKAYGVAPVSLRALG